jgi:hypothetical protein
MQGGGAGGEDAGSSNIRAAGSVDAKRNTGAEGSDMKRVRARKKANFA